jgi:hypothetical protein
MHVAMIRAHNRLADRLRQDGVPAGRVVHWPLLLDVPGQPPAQRAKAIDGRLPTR